MACESGKAGVALEARACLKGLIVLSRGHPVRFQGDRGVRQFRMGMLGLTMGAR